jgi:putative zinc finger/helix-turn-helix YgiT family protein
MEKTINICPKCNGRMMLKQIDKTISFKGEKLDIQFETYVCEDCDLHVGTVEQTAVIQNLIADAYRKKVGLLTGQEIREKREELGISQKELAKIKITDTFKDESYFKSLDDSSINILIVSKTKKLILTPKCISGLKPKMEYVNQSANC